ncbi:hypothetical protein [Henriciella sp.]|uniref:hypothetical protein n=1 Tax=Henriciella sp. TaxID=1968823 RepID=UPI0026373C1F|nr:hypothetical protein [Henriciella sp.]
MNVFAATLVTILFTLSQVICGCPHLSSTFSDPAEGVSPYSHQVHTNDREAPCEKDRRHCNQHAAAVAQPEAAAKTISPGESKPVFLPLTSRLMPAFWSRSIAIAIRYGGRPVLKFQTPVTLKTRLLN